jgi:hypothetical protein
MVARATDKVSILQTNNTSSSTSEYWTVFANTRACAHDAHTRTSSSSSLALTQYHTRAHARTSRTGFLLFRTRTHTHTTLTHTLTPHAHATCCTSWRRPVCVCASEVELPSRVRPRSLRRSRCRDRVHHRVGRRHRHSAFTHRVLGSAYDHSRVRWSRHGRQGHRSCHLSPLSRLAVRANGRSSTSVRCGQRSVFARAYGTRKGRFTSSSQGGPHVPWTTRSRPGCSGVGRSGRHKSVRFRSHFPFICFLFQ